MTATIDGLRALTVRQPWAWAIAHGGKNIENRRRYLGNYTGDLYIHAATTRYNTRDWNDAINEIAAIRRAEVPVQASTYGAIIAVVEVTDVHPVGICQGNPQRPAWACTPWARAALVHYVLANPRPLTTPVPAQSARGLWRPGDDVIAAVTAQLTRQAAA